MAEKSIKLILELDDKQVEATLKKLPKEFEDSGKKSGKEFGDGVESGASKAFSSLKSKILSVGAALVTAFGAKKSIEAAARQQDAVQRLNNSLANIGEFSQKATLDLQNFAASIEETTRFSDEAVLEQLAFAQAMGATAEQSEKVVNAATDLATALNIDLNSATRNIAKTLGGFAGELGETIPELKELTQEQLRAGEGIELLAARYSGRAAQDVATFSGALEQLKNAFGTVLENIGKIITNNPIVIKGINALTKVFVDLANTIDSTNIKELTLNIIEFGRSVTEFVVAPLELAFNLINFVFLKLKEGVAAVVAVIAADLGRLGDLLNSFGVDNTFTQGLQTFRESSNEVFQEIANDANESFNNILNPEVAVSLDQKLEQVKEKVNEIGEGTSIAAKINEEVKKSTSSLETLKKAFVGVADSAKRGLGQGIASGFAAMGAALAKGENALDAFVKSFLGAIGQMAIQLGSIFILQGIGFKLIPGLQANGVGLVAAGGALALAGGALTAIAGSIGGTPTPAVSSTGGGTPVEVTNPVGDLQGIERDEVQESVVINIQGDYFDSDDANVRLFERINNAADSLGVSINRGALA